MAKMTKKRIPAGLISPIYPENSKHGRILFSVLTPERNRKYRANDLEDIVQFICSIEKKNFSITEEIILLCTLDNGPVRFKESGRTYIVYH